MLLLTAEKWIYLGTVGSPTERHQHPFWFALVLRVAINTGARRGEILKIDWNDIDVGEREITLHGANTKTRKTRQVKISDVLLRQLNSINADPTHNGCPIFSVACARKPWARFIKMAALPDMTPHGMRRHVESTLMRRGAPLPAVSKLLVHASVKATQK